MKFKKEHLSPKGWAHGLASKWLLFIGSFFSVLKVTGLENIPRKGGAVIIANHLSYFDAVALASALERSKRDAMVLAKSELFRVPWRARLLTALGVIPVYRGSDKAADALNEAVKSLKGGELVALFPEGTIPKDGALLPFKTGAARMALEANVPVIPVVMVGTDHIIASNLRKIKRTLFKRAILQHPVKVSIGEPIYLAGDHLDPANVVLATEKLHQAVVEGLRTLDVDRGEGPKLSSNKRFAAGGALTIPIIGGIVHLMILMFRRKR